MHLKQFTLLAAAAMLFASCSKIYTPALYHQDIAYQPKPASFDSVKSATYVSAGIDNFINNSGSDFQQSGQLNISRGHAFKNTNLAYGAFCVLGDYENGTLLSGDKNYFNDKFFGLVGARASFTFFANDGRTDSRFIGVEAAYSHEFGDYLNFRRTVSGLPDYTVDTRSDLFSIGLSTEILFHNYGNPNFQHGIRGFIGATLGNNSVEDGYGLSDINDSKLFREIFPKVSYFIKFSKFFGTIE